MEGVQAWFLSKQCFKVLLIMLQS
uniref:Uncharacterized protein n=1 Tax=Arundo donax TaxID=35708 RepID=A0A0A8YD65_ARUDO